MTNKFQLEHNAEYDTYAVHEIVKSCVLNELNENEPQKNLYIFRFWDQTLTTVQHFKVH